MTNTPSVLSALIKKTIGTALVAAFSVLTVDAIGDLSDWSLLHTAWHTGLTAGGIQVVLPWAIRQSEKLKATKLQDF